jgi:hypothetical protein
MTADQRDERDERMDEASCLYVLSLLMDGRPVEPGLARAARAWAESHPECERALADWKLQAQALAELPALTASPGFTERVLAAAERAGSLARAGVRPAGAIEAPPAFARQFALAAGVALLLSLAFVLARPADLRADSGIARHRHAVDGFRASPFVADDIEAGLRARLADPEFGAQLARSGR